MNRLLTAILVVSVFGSAAFAETESEPAAKPATDLCKDAVDPYEWIGQKTRFFAAAGPDNELTEKEFAANKQKTDGFVRSFDTWKAIATFDKDGNKSIDWLEADAYRRALRNKVLAAYDANKDRKLTGDERTAANKALAEGKVSAARTAGRVRGSWAGREDMIKQYDKDGDGKLSEAEQQAAREAWRARWELRRYDANRDGKLDEKETAARDKARAEREERRKEFMKRFDKNENGRIDSDERAGIGEYYRQQRRKRELERYDKDGDGELSDEEKAARDEERRKRIAEWRARSEMRRYDADRDGKLDDEETAARDKGRAEREERRKEFIKRFDKNNDGELNDEERRAMGEYWRSRFGRGRGRGGPRGGPPRGE